jgi:hypothetical protein
MSQTLFTYGGSGLIPAPLVNLRKVFQRAGEDTKLGTSWEIRLAGKFVPFMGSPNGFGAFTSNNVDLAQQSLSVDSRMGSIQRKQEAVRALFSTDGLPLIWQTPAQDSAASICYPIVDDVSFNDGTWVTPEDYSISLHAPYFVAGPYSVEHDLPYQEFISSASETWSINPGDFPGTFEVSRSISAQGKTVYFSGGVKPSSAYDYARSFCQNQLGFGFNTISHLLGTSGGTFLANSALSAGNIPLSGLSIYNVVKVEQVDQLGGSYAVTETYILSSGNALNSYTINKSVSPQGGSATQAVTIQGNVRGLYVNQNDYATRYTNALTYFNNTVQPNLYSIASSVASGTLVSYPTVSTVDYDILNGQISYGATYDNRTVGTSGVEESYTVSKSQSLDDFSTTVRVEGSLAGRSDTDPSIKLANADYYYNQLLNSGTFYNRAVLYSQISGIHPLAQNQTKTVDAIKGEINYGFEYNTRLYNPAIEEFQVQKSYDRNDGLTTVSVQGTVKGLATTIYASGMGINTQSGIAAIRFANASGYYYNNILPLIPYRAITLGSPVVQTGKFLSQSEGIDLNGGVISYSYTYNSMPLPLFSGALNEIISFNWAGGGQVFASIPIVGRASGTIDQNMGTINKRTATLQIELIFPPPTGNSWAALYSNKPDPSPIITAFQPNGSFSGDVNESYNIQNGRYSFSQSYTIQT